MRGNGEEFVIKKRIQLSEHSYIDIIQALCDLTPAAHFKLVTVLLEQLTYKSNPECQYEYIEL